MNSDGGSNEDRSEENEPLADLQRLLNEMLSGGKGFDPEQFSKFAGVPFDMAMMNNLMGSLQNAMKNQSDGIDWTMSRRIALGEAATTPTADPAPSERAFPVATLWLDEVTELGASPDAPRTLTPTEWVQQSMDTWVSLAEPVAAQISRALTESLTNQLPEQFQSSVQGFAPILNSVAGALFANQLGQIIGKLSTEVVAGGDVGIPLFQGQGKEGGVLVPTGVNAFAEGLDQDLEAVTLYLAVRELAHARLFRHARWLTLNMMSAMTDFAKGMSINSVDIEALAVDIDPSNTDAMQELLASGALIPPKTPEQIAAHERLETLLALVEGWVDVVTERAVTRLPGAEGIAEMVRRRRAAGGPAEHAFSTLIGLELRPRRMREAASLFRLVDERGGAAQRDALWSHPDVLPTLEELDHPARLLERLGLAGATPEDAPLDDFDRELADLLDEAKRSEDKGTEGTEGTD